MITDDEFKKMRLKLAEAIAELCANCDKPQIQPSKVNLDDPEACKCECYKVKGMREALRGIVIKPE
ncbi:hypothetical protein ACFL12_08050 [Pseudomonadota bacterium]